MTRRRDVYMSPMPGAWAAPPGDLLEPIVLATPCLCGVDILAGAEGVLTALPVVAADAVVLTRSQLEFDRGAVSFFKLLLLRAINSMRRSIIF